MQNFALVDAQEEYEEHTMADDKVVVQNDAKSANKNAFFSMFSNDMTYFEGYHVKADILRIPKMWYFLRFRGFKPELLLPKVRSFSKYLFWKVSVSKKNPTATILICRLQH